MPLTPILRHFITPSPPPPTVAELGRVQTIVGQASYRRRLKSSDFSYLVLLCFLCLFAAPLCAPAADSPSAIGTQHPESPPLPPDAALAAIHVRDGYTIERVAAEPLTQDPTAIAWGPDGKLWVAEMTDYPLGRGGKMVDNKPVDGAPLGRIRVLEDTNGDGVYDTSQIFIEGVAYANGVMPWRDGVLITAAPDVLYAEDTDGDGVADKREILLNGFNEGNQQLRVNGLRWGLDNMVHCANGSHRAGYGGNERRIKSTRNGSETDIGSRDFRFDPDSGELDPQSGPSQFGRCRDDWGNWFGNMNSFPLWQFLLRDHYIRRNPHVSSPDPRVQFFPRSAHVFPAKEPQKRYHSFAQSGRFTSACSPTIYRDNLLFPRDKTGTIHAFTCEPFHNLVQHNVLIPNGATFRAGERDSAEASVDFFASKDRWCRPVTVRTGPDGALWIVDMYRYIIEHPQFLTPEGRIELEEHYRAGHEYGRIYRVYPEGKKPRPIPRLDRLTTPQLVAALDSPNGWQRDTAQQLLVWKNDKSAARHLVNLFRDSANPLARLHALCTLDGLRALSPEILSKGLTDDNPGVRRHAIRLTENRLEGVPKDVLESLAADPDPGARLQLANSAGFWPPDIAGLVLGRLASNTRDDPYLMAAILSSTSAANLEKTTGVLGSANKQGGDGSGRIMGELLALSVAFEKPDVTLATLDSIVRPDVNGAYSPWQRGIVAGLLDALKRKKQTLASLAEKAGEPANGVAERIAALITEARAIALDPGAKIPDRTSALRLMARQPQKAPRDEDVLALANLLEARTPLPIQIAAVTHLGSLPDQNIAGHLFERWPTLGAAVRTKILEFSQSRLDWLTVLLDSVESKHVHPSDIDASTRQRLIIYPNKKVRDRSEALFAASVDPDRQRILEKFQPALELAGDPAHGKEVFVARCAICHQLAGEGIAVGPDLNSITDRKPAALLASIIDPSAAIDARFINYTATATDGSVFSGYLASETGTGITLQGPATAKAVILRTELKELRSTGKSMMPDGLEAELSHQQMADLLAYLTESITRSP